VNLDRVMKLSSALLNMTEDDKTNLRAIIDLGERNLKKKVVNRRNVIDSKESCEWEKCH